MKQLLFTLFAIAALYAQAQQPKSFPKISGTLGVSYEGYGLDRNPSSNTVFTKRRPWHQVRFTANPVFEISKNFKLPVNVNIAAFPTNFAGPYAGIGKQSFKQYLTNPMNNFGLNPTYKWAEFQLGTQYLNYSDLSTGDVGIFGAGFSLTPNNFVVKFFHGTSQQGINPIGIVNPGAYKRNHTMVQIGKEKQGEYKVALNFVKGKDFLNSVTPSPLPSAPAPAPQEAFNISLVGERDFDNKMYLKTEVATNIYTTNITSAVPAGGVGVPNFKPFITGRTSTQRGYAATAKVGRKSTHFDIGLGVKYYDANFFTMGFPYLQSDRIDGLLDTRFNFLKDKNGSYKSNIVASVGVRTNNLSLASKSNQFIGNINWFTQFSEKFGLNVNFNNFGFNVGTPSSSFSIKSVSNDLSVSPTYSWSNSKRSNTLSFSYSYSKYVETFIIPPSPTTTNVTHSFLLNYIPVYFTRKIMPDFSVLYFVNNSTFVDLSLLTATAGLGLPLKKDKIQLKGQLQYTLGKLQVFTPNHNVVASLNCAWKLQKKLTWSTWLNSNYFKYGNELSTLPPLLNANYLESILRTGFTYKF